MSGKTTRRQFIKTASVGAAAVAMSASSYARVKGANDRISIGMIGCGSRGIGAHMTEVNKYAKEQNVEFTAVCDPWRTNCEAAAAKAQEWYGKKAKQFVSHKDLLALDSIDAVMIASCDHWHTTQLKDAADAKKDVYVEKPMAKTLEGLIAAVDAVKAAGVVCQVGTQLRSLPSMTGARDLYATGILGKVARIEQCRNTEDPYWYHYYNRPVKAEEVDWKEFLGDVPDRPFNPVECAGWYGFRHFSDGPVPGYGSHFIDLVHYITGAQFPTSAVCLGGVYTWIDENKFTCPDHVHALWTYPEGFMVSYSSNFGNGSGNSFKIFGDVGVMDLVNWTEPFVTAEGGSKNKGAIRGKDPVKPVERPDHFLDWLQCIRSRKTPNAPIEAGYNHSIANLLAVKAFDTGRRQVYDHATRTIREG